MASSTEPPAAPTARAMQQPPELRQLAVYACGRSVVFDAPEAAGHCTSLLEVQQRLHAALQTEGKTFDFFDAQGEFLPTDAHLREALLRGRAPLFATLCGGVPAYHCGGTDPYFTTEAHGKKLAEVQWKLMRDHVTCTVEQVSDLRRQIAGLSLQHETSKRGHVKELLIQKGELQSSIEAMRERMASELGQMYSRSAAQERSHLESCMRCLQTRLTEMREAFELDKSLRKQEMALVNASAEGCQRCMEIEQYERQALMEKQHHDMLTFNARLDALLRTRAEEKAAPEETEQVRRKPVDEFSAQQQQQQGVRLEQLRAKVDSVAKTVAAQRQQFEGWYLALQNHVSKTMSVQVTTIGRANERISRLSDLFVRQNERGDALDMEGVSRKLEELERMIEASSAEACRLHQLEQEEREEHVTRASRAVLAECNGKLRAASLELTRETILPCDLDRRSEVAEAARTEAPPHYPAETCATTPLFPPRPGQAAAHVLTRGGDRAVSPRLIATRQSTPLRGTAVLAMTPAVLPTVSVTSTAIEPLTPRRGVLPLKFAAPHAVRQPLLCTPVGQVVLRQRSTSPTGVHRSYSVPVVWGQGPAQSQPPLREGRRSAHSLATCRS